MILSGLLFIALMLSLYGNWVLFCQREDAMRDLRAQEWATEHARNNK